MFVETKPAYLEVAFGLVEVTKREAYSVLDEETAGALTLVVVGAGAGVVLDEGAVELLELAATTGATEDDELDTTCTSAAAAALLLPAKQFDASGSGCMTVLSKFMFFPVPSLKKPNVEKATFSAKSTVKSNSVASADLIPSIF